MRALYLVLPLWWGSVTAMRVRHDQVTATKVASASEGGAALAKRAPSEDLEDEKTQALVAGFARGVAKGREAELQLSCESLPEMMVRVMEQGSQHLGKLCGGGSGRCSNETYVGEEKELLEELFAVQQLLGGLASEAHKKFCLAATMRAPEVQAKLREMLDAFAKPLLASGGSGEATERLELAYGKLLAWQQGTVDHAPRIIDRSTLLPMDIQDPSHCPEQCRKCTRRKHIFGKQQSFGFKCFLKRGRSPPRFPGLQCSSPKPRLAFRKKSWCEVQDWEASACQQFWVSALLSCGARSILDGLLFGAGGDAEKPDQARYETCMEHEQHWDRTSNDYWGLADNVVPKWLSLSFGIFSNLGLMSGLAALQEEAAGNKLWHPSAKAEAEAPSTAETLLEPFTLGRSMEALSSYRLMYKSSKREVDCEGLVRFLAGCQDFWKTLAWRDLAGAFMLTGTVASAATVPLLLAPATFLFLLAAFTGTSFAPGLVLGGLYGLFTTGGAGVLMYVMNQMTPPSEGQCTLFHRVEVGATCPGSAAAVHAGVKVQVEAAATCKLVMEEMQARIGGQYALWHDPHNNGTYSLVAGSNATDGEPLELTRATGNKKYTDKLTFTFAETGSAQCLIRGCSQSQVNSVIDYSTNYCNLRMLYCGAEDGCKVVKHDFKVTEPLIDPTPGAGTNMTECLRM